LTEIAEERELSPAASKTNGRGLDLLARAYQEPPLSAAEEKRIARLAELGDRAARERLINSHLRLVIHLARQYARRPEDVPDLVQDGLVGLIDAVDRFDWRRPNRFSTYAAFSIRRAIFRSHQGLIRIPEHRREKAWTVKRARQQLRNQLGREPEASELAAATGLGEDAVELALQGPPLVVSADEGGTNGDAPPLLDQLPGEDDVFDHLEARERRRALDTAFASLPMRFRRLFTLRYGLDGGAPLPLAEAGSMLGLDRHQAYRLEAAGLKRLARDHTLRQAVGRLRSLFPFGLASPWSLLKGSFAGGSGVKAAAAVAVAIGSTAAVSAWQHIGPFAHHVPPTAPAQAAPNQVAAVAVTGSPAPTAAAAEQFGGLALPVPPTAIASAAEPPARSSPPQNEQEATGGTAGTPTASNTTSPPSTPSAAEPQAGASDRESQPYSDDSPSKTAPTSGDDTNGTDGLVQSSAGSAVEAVNEAVSALPLPEPIASVADGALETIGGGIDALPAVDDVLPPGASSEPPPLTVPDIVETVGNVSETAGGLPGSP
jgi:RNA polymerase sigma factor (sigma-70 family)